MATSGSAININTLDYAFQNNTIQDNQTAYDLQFQMSNANTLVVENNYWGTTDGDTIAGRIFDFFDDSGKGVVDFEPFLDAPSAGVPPTQPTGLAVSGSTQTSITLNWLVHPDADVAAWLHWRTE